MQSEEVAMTGGLSSGPRAWASERREFEATARDEHLDARIAAADVATDLPLCVPRRDSGPTPSAMRPCAPGLGHLGNPGRA